MDLFSIPEEVFHHDLFPKLNWNDLLRLRRVSHQSKFLADGYLKIHPDIAPEIEVNETDKTMDKFLELGIPTAKLYLNNPSRDMFYEKYAGALSTFLHEHGPLITHLRVDQYSYLILAPEWDFFDGLPNLRYFEAKNCGVGRVHDRESTQKLSDKHDHEAGLRGSFYPKIFKSLKKLRMDSDRKPIAFLECRTLMVRRFCENLEHLALPFCAYNAVLPCRTADSTLGAAFRRLHQQIIKLDNPEHPNPSYLKEYDFRFHYINSNTSKIMTAAEARVEEQEASNDLLNLCETCSKNDVKLQTVRAYWFQSAPLQNANPELGSCVSSMVFLHPSLAFVELPNMELLLIKTSCSGVVVSPDPPNWPSLNELGIVIDSTKMEAWSLPQAPSCKLLFHFLFSNNASHLKLTRLALAFKSEGESCVPKADNIVSACPNLKILRLANWPGTNKALVTLWKGLPRLEEINLDGCKKLGNNAFVGEDVCDPVFFKLSGLKKLSLRSLDEMPKVTDTLFQLVLQHLSLTHLELSSTAPVKNVTSSGIRALLNGKFAGSIEKFRFKGWSLADCSEEEFISLGSQFRSHNMI